MTDLKFTFTAPLNGFADRFTQSTPMEKKVRQERRLLIRVLFFFAACISFESAHGSFSTDKLADDLAHIVESSPVRGVSLAVVKLCSQHDSLQRPEVKTLAIGDVAMATLSPSGDRVGSISYPKLIPDMAMPVGSISKLITGLLVLRAVQADVIALDDPVERYLPGVFQSKWSTPVTVAMLLEHAAGLGGSTYRDYAANTFGIGPLAYVQGRQPFILRWQPGKHYSYANDGATIAAALVEEAWDADFDTLVQREIFTPLEMKSSHFSPREVFAKEHSRVLGFDADGQTLMPIWSMPIRPSGALNSTPRDLAQVISMLLRRGKLSDDSTFLEPSHIRRMERAETSMAARHGVGHTSYGLGNFLYLEAGKAFHGHWGKTEGFSATLGYQPGKREGYVMIVNTADAPTVHRLRKAIASAVGVEKSETSSQQGNKVIPLNPDFSDEKLAKIPVNGATFVGHTHDHAQRAWLFGLLMACKIAPSGDDLILAPLLPLGLDQCFISEGTVYRERNIPVATAVLVRDRDALWWVDGESYRHEPASKVWLKLFALLAGPLAACIAVVVSFAHFTSRCLGKMRREKNHLIKSIGSLNKSDRFTGIYLLGLSGLALVGFWYIFLTRGLLGGPGTAATLGQYGVISLLITGLSVLSPVLLMFATGVHLRKFKFRGARSLGHVFSFFFLCAASVMGAHFFLLAANHWLPLVTW